MSRATITRSIEPEQPEHPDDAPPRRLPLWMWALLTLVVAPVVANAGFALMTETSLWDRVVYDPEVAVTATAPGGTIYGTDDTEVGVVVRNVGDDDIEQISLAIGPTECPTNAEVASGATSEELVCTVPASQARDAGTVLVLDAAGTQVGTGAFDLTVIPSPCPSLAFTTRGPLAPSIDEFVGRWNDAVAATRGVETQGEADACEDLGPQWEIGKPTASGAKVGEHSRINWDVDVDDRLVNVSLFLSTGGAGDDQLREDALRGVLGNAVAHDRAQAAQLSAEWSATCTGTSSIETEDDPSVLAARFC